MLAKHEKAAAAALCLGVLLAGVAALWRLTDGLQRFTTESWRRAAIAAAPRPLPDVMVQDQRGRVWPLRGWCGKPMLVEFIYTQCPSVCKASGAASALLAQRFDPTDSSRVAVLSLSIDAANDTPQRMARYKHSLEASPSSWTVARPLGVRATQSLLETFGVIVVPDGQGGFEHNAAWHAVDPACRVAQVFDAEDIERASQWLHARLQ